MSPAFQQYRALEKRIRDLIGERGATSERVKCLDQMDRLWAEIPDHEKAVLVGELKEKAS